MQTSSEPYIGPRPFEQTDREIFFGRGREVSELVSLMTAYSEVLLYGQSGAGKTSLVKAGLIHTLVEEERFTVFPPMRVRENVAAGMRPQGVSNVYMFNALSSISKPDEVDGLAGVSLEEYLTEHKQSGGNGDSTSPTIIIFDQFEELFTFYPEHWEDRKDFFKQVRHALKDDPLLRVLFSMREDFIAELDPYVALLPEKMRIRFRVERLREKTALNTVIQPLEKVQTRNGKPKFAEGVAEQLVNNLLQVQVKTPDGVRRVKGEFVEALQLQVVCQALWQNLRDDDVLITREHLEAFGDVDKALAQFYENAIDKTVKATAIKEGKLRKWFERALITPTGTRGTVFRGETDTGGIPNAVVDELENQRIIRMELRGGAQWYELTHDRFVETVKTSNQKWLLARPAAEEVGNRLEDKASNWDQADRSDELLLDEVELRLAEEWLKSADTAEIEPSRNLLAFVRASKHQIETQQREAIEQQERIEQQARTARLFRRLTVAVGLLAITGFAALVFAGYHWKKANGEIDKRDQAERARIEAETQAKKIEEQNAALEGTNVELALKGEMSNVLSQAYTTLASGRLDDAEALYLKLLKTYEEMSAQGTDTQAAIARTNSSLGDIWLKRGNYPNAIARYDKALEIYKGQQSNNSEGQTCLKKGLLYFDWGKRKQKNADHSEALKRFEYSSDYFKRALTLFRKAKNKVGAYEAENGLEEAERRSSEIKTILNPPDASAP